MENSSGASANIVLTALLKNIGKGLLVILSLMSIVLSARYVWNYYVDHSAQPELVEVDGKLYSAEDLGVGDVPVQDFEFPPIGDESAVVGEGATPQFIRGNLASSSSDSLRVQSNSGEEEVRTAPTTLYHCVPNEEVATAWIDTSSLDLEDLEVGESSLLAGEKEIQQPQVGSSIGDHVIVMRKKESPAEAARVWIVGCGN